MVIFNYSVGQEDRITMKIPLPLRRSLIYGKLFRNNISFLDLSARSALWLSKYELAAKKYRTADKYGLHLRDHNINHFNAEIRAGFIEEAYSIMASGDGENFDSQMSEILKSLKKLNENERVENNPKYRFNTQNT